MRISQSNRTMAVCVYLHLCMYVCCVYVYACVCVCACVCQICGAMKQKANYSNEYLCSWMCVSCFLMRGYVRLRVKPIILFVIGAAPFLFFLLLVLLVLLVLWRCWHTKRIMRTHVERTVCLCFTNGTFFNGLIMLINGCVVCVCSVCVSVCVYCDGCKYVYV